MWCASNIAQYVIIAHLLSDGAFILMYCPRPFFSLMTEIVRCSNRPEGPMTTFYCCRSYSWVFSWCGPIQHNITNSISVIKAELNFNAPKYSMLIRPRTIRRGKSGRVHCEKYDWVIYVVLRLCHMRSNKLRYSRCIAWCYQWPQLIGSVDMSTPCGCASEHYDDGAFSCFRNRGQSTALAESGLQLHPGCLYSWYQIHYALHAVLDTTVRLLHLYFCGHNIDGPVQALRLDIDCTFI